MADAPFDLGRKIFFLHAPDEFQDIVIPMLSSVGYEIYLLSSYKHAKAILKEHPKSVFYVCIDKELLIDQWYNFISSFNEQKEFSDVIIGVMATYAGKNEKDHFLLNTSIPGGYVSLAQDPILVHDYIYEILLINNAKGKRNFVRANCIDQSDVFATYTVNGFDCPLKILNISSAGLLCTTNKSLAPLFTQSKTLSKFLISLRDQKIVSAVTIFRTQIEGDTLQIVLLFAEELPYIKRSLINMYVRTFLQEKLDAQIQTLQHDQDDYSKREKSAIAGDTDEAFLISVEKE